jgi:hypothetical protein
MAGGVTAASPICFLFLVTVTNCGVVTNSSIEGRSGSLDCGGKALQIIASKQLSGLDLCV